jgi:lysine 2,3-aminomutase
MQEISRKLWNDWRWQVRHSARNEAALERWLRLSDDERAALRNTRGGLPVAVTPYFLRLLDPADPNDPLRRTVVPCMAEFRARRGEHRDPLGEENHLAAPGLVHTYPDKVLFLAARACAVYCRYCTRARWVGRNGGLPSWDIALDYIRRTPRVRDVLISGGEPLMLSDERLESLLRSLRAISHVEIIRISTKAPAALPQRITPALARMLRKYHPIWMSVHFIHPRELTAESARACERLADSGVPLCSQTVLLKGINDDEDTLRRLMNGLLKMRVKPYYLHQCDAIEGRSHFRAPLERGVELIESLHGRTTGYAVPWFMLDAPGGGGKVPLAPNYVVQRKNGTWVLRNFEGRLYTYEEPPVTSRKRLPGDT